jgi:Universal stress protein UspA and related nucleotide-binding proteins
MTTTHTNHETAELGSYYPPVTTKKSGPILAATDRTDASLPALRAARVLDGEFHSGVTVLVVVEPLPIIVPEPTSLIQPVFITPELSSVVREQALHQITTVGEAGSSWVIDVEDGRPSREIADAARRLNSRLIVLGLSHHGLIDRLIDGDTALEVLRESDAPVLLASNKLTTLPRVIVVAVDFSPESMNAARTALKLVAADAVIHLTHVRPPVTIFDGSGLWEEEYERVATQQLEKFNEVLDVPAGLEVVRKIVEGKPAHALADYANAIDADLIVSGSHGAGLMRRIFVGSVASGLLRKSERSLLIVPMPRQHDSGDVQA